MINPVRPPASHVVAAEIEGEITKEDVKEVISLLESGLETSPRISLFFDLSKLSGFSVSAFLNDLAYSLKNLGRLYRFQQVAIVTSNPSLEKIVAWEDWLFSSIEMKSFSPEQRNEALAWVEKKLELPEPGFQSEKQDGYLMLTVGQEVTGYDITRMAELVQDEYEENGPVRLMVRADGVPKLGPGLVYEKLRQFKLLRLVARYALVGPDTLKSRMKLVRPLINTEIKHFLPTDSDAAQTWLLDDSPKVVEIPTDSEDRVGIRMEGRITSTEIKAFYEILLKRLKGDNGVDALLEIPYQDGITLRAIFQAIKLGIQHYNQVTKGLRRVAIITDSRFLSKATEVENILLPSVEERPFTFNQRHIAMAWLQEGREAVGALTTRLPEAGETKLLEE